MRPNSPLARWGRAGALVAGLSLVALSPALAQRTPVGAARAKAVVVAPPRPLTRLSREDVEKLASAELDALVGKPGSKLVRGVRVVLVRAPGSVELPGPVTRRDVDIVPPPRKAGSVATAATLTLATADGDIARIALHVQLLVPPEAATYEVPKGSTVSVVVQRGLIEVSSAGVTAADADVGDVVSVLVRQSGRMVRARIVARDRALVTEERQ